MKNILVLLTLLILVLSAISLAGAQSPNNEDRVRLYIQATTNEGRAAQNDLDVRHEFGNGVVSVEVSARAAEQLADNPHFTLLGTATQWHLAEPPGSCTPWPECKNSGVEGPVPATRTYIPNDQTPWGMEAVYKNKILTSTSGGLNVKVAVLDTGAFINHLDIKNRLYTGQCKDFTKIKVQNGCTDNNGHGTHTAGTVAADAGTDKKGIYGVAPEAKLFIYKVCGAQFCWSDDIAAAINHATDQGANIISMSLGGSSLALIEKNAIDRAVDNNVLVIAAAGNSGPNLGTIEYPGAYSKVVAVAALDSSLSVARFSSRGINDGDFIIEEREVEVSLPGVAIESTWNDGAYKTISGTSMATPHAAGLAAKYWKGSASDTRTWLQNRAKLNDINSGQLAGVGDDAASGFGFPTTE